jgi:chromosome partitioning protein
MGKVVAVTNQKGGVGKTTTGINVAASLARTHRRVLLIDLDPQGNATVGSGVDKDDVTATIYEVLLGEASVEQARVSTGAGFDLVPANSELAGAQVELIEAEGRDRRLRQALGPVREQYDYIFIDCPPALNLLTVNALAAADAVMIPMQCEYFAMEGLSALVNTIRKVCCAPCTTRATASRARCPASSRIISVTRSTAPSFRVMSAWPRHPASGGR